MAPSHSRQTDRARLHRRWTDAAGGHPGRRRCCHVDAGRAPRLFDSWDAGVGPRRNDTTMENCLRMSPGPPVGCGLWSRRSTRAHTSTKRLRRCSVVDELVQACTSACIAVKPVAKLVRSYVQLYKLVHLYELVRAFTSLHSAGCLYELSYVLVRYDVVYKNCTSSYMRIYLFYSSLFRRRCRSAAPASRSYRTSCVCSVTTSVSPFLASACSDAVAITPLPHTFQLPRPSPCSAASCSAPWRAFSPLFGPVPLATWSCVTVDRNVSSSIRALSNW